MVAQKGAREHYAVALALKHRGMLAGLITDWYATPSFLRFANAFSGLLGTRCRSALAARCEGIPDSLVHAFPVRSLFWKFRERLLTVHGRSYQAFQQTDRAFALATARLKLPLYDVYFGYSYASLEMLELVKSHAKTTILSQIDPGPMHIRIVAKEMARHPELAGPPAPYPQFYFERSRREWELADIIVVNSEWSREALISEGVNPAKIEILPLPYELRPGKKNVGDEKRKQEITLRVLYLGQVTPGKGIAYLIEAARLLTDTQVRIDVVGTVGILPEAVAAAPKNIIFHGPVSRDRVAEWYNQSEVFVLPTLSDGFALTQLEAMSHGVPVIATPNCGRVVEDGNTGFIVPACDPQALASAIMRFASDRNLSAKMAASCRATSRRYSVDAYGRRLLEIIQNLKTH